MAGKDKDSRHQAETCVRGEVQYGDLLCGAV